MMSCTPELPTEKSVNQLKTVFGDGADDDVAACKFALSLLYVSLRFANNHTHCDVRSILHN